MTGWAEPAAGFFRWTAVAAASSAVAVLVAQLGLSGWVVPSGEGALAQLYLDPTFRAQEALILGQVMLMFVALVGVAAGWVRKSPGLILMAVAFLLLWQVLELVPRSVDVFAASGRWAPAWQEATSEVERTSWLAMLEAWQGAWSAIGVVRRIVWGLAHLFFGLALVRGTALDRVLGILFLFNAARLLPRTLGSFLGVDALVGLGAGRFWFIAGMAPLFAVAALWLWRRGSTAGPRPEGVPEGGLAPATAEPARRGEGD